MKKIYLFTLMTLFTMGAYSQNQLCVAQVTGNSTLNKCFGDCNGTANCYPGGTGSYKFNWSNGATTQNISGLCAGSYTCSVTDLGDGTKCSGVATITTPTTLVVSGSSAGNTATATVTGGSPGYTYLWTPSGQTGATATGLSNGVYTVTVTDKNGCTKSTVVTVFSTGINAGIAAGHGINIYPNPASDIINLEMETVSTVVTQISFVNVLGATVYSESISANGPLKKSIDISTLPAGMYFISVRSNNDVMIEKIIKQ